MKNNNESNGLLNGIKGELVNAPFKTAFKAVLGFYAAQLVATVLGLMVISGVVAVLFYALGK
jgi:hypothetical protein